MKLNVDFTQLWRNVEQMGADAVELDLGNVWRDSELEFDDQLSTSGVEINLEGLETEQGLLSVRGRQVILFIPDHGSRVENVMVSGENGNKFHIADCITLDSMKLKKSFERYKVTNNLSGEFDIFGLSKTGRTIEGLAKLHVCKNCIKKLNYKGAANVMDRDKIVASFDVEAFFTTYSSVFKRLPKQHVKDAGRGYSENWSNIATAVKYDAKFICQCCKIDCSKHKRLLHVHHKNRDKSDNSIANLVSLCADCHRKEPFHGHMFVKHDDTQQINRLRREQNLFPDINWQNIRRMADPALFGILDHCELKKYSAPAVSFELTSDDGKEKALLELAWPQRRFGVVMNKPIAKAGWRILTLNDALIFFSKRKIPTA